LLRHTVPREDGELVWVSLRGTSTLHVTWSARRILPAIDPWEPPWRRRIWRLPRIRLQAGSFGCIRCSRSAPRARADRAGWPQGGHQP